MRTYLKVMWLFLANKHFQILNVIPLNVHWSQIIKENENIAE